jgi:hypothetical protein
MVNIKTNIRRENTVISNQTWDPSDIKESLIKEGFCLRNVLALS